MGVDDITRVHTTTTTSVKPQTKPPRKFESLGTPARQRGVEDLTRVHTTTTTSVKPQTKPPPTTFDSLGTSTGHHPFIAEPDEWVGTPWDDARPPAPPSPSNAELAAALRGRVAATAATRSRARNRRDDVGGSGGAAAAAAARVEAYPAAAAAGKKSGRAAAATKARRPWSTLGPAPKPTPSAADLAASSSSPEAAVAANNPFGVALKARALPLAFAFSPEEARLFPKGDAHTVPLAWTLPYGFGVRHLDPATYLPLCAHGVRATGCLDGACVGAVALQALRDLLHCFGPPGRTFAHLKPTVLALRIAFLAAADGMEGDGHGGAAEDAVAVGMRALEALVALATCDDPGGEGDGDGGGGGRHPQHHPHPQHPHPQHHPSIRGANVLALFAGRSNTLFATAAAPLGALRSRILGSTAFARAEPYATKAARRIYLALQELEERGGTAAARAILAAFPAGYAA